MPESLDQIPLDQEITTVTANGVFDTRKNAKLWKSDTAGAITRNEIPRTSKCLWRTIWRGLSGYHRRSRAEIKIHSVKLLGQRLSARDFDRQVAEFRIRVVVLNGLIARVTPITHGCRIGLS